MLHCPSIPDHHATVPDQPLPRLSMPENIRPVKISPAAMHFAAPMHFRNANTGQSKNPEAATAVSGFLSFSGPLRMPEC